MTPIPQFSHTVVKSYFYLKPWSAWLHSIPTAARTSCSYPSTHLPPSRGRADPVGARLRRRGRGAGGAALLTGAGGQRRGAPARAAWAEERRGSLARVREASGKARRHGRWSSAGGRRRGAPARTAERRGRLVAGLAGPGGGAAREAAGGRAGTEAESGVGRRWGWDGVRESAPDARPKTARDRASEQNFGPECSIQYSKNTVVYYWFCLNHGIQNSVFQRATKHL